MLGDLVIGADCRLHLMRIHDITFINLDGADGTYCACHWIMSSNLFVDFSTYCCYHLDLQHLCQCQLWIHTVSQKMSLL